MKHCLVCAVWAALLPLAAVPADPAGEQHPWVDVQVVERLRDRVIGGLQQSDFQVTADGRSVQLVGLVAGRVPLDLVVIEPARDVERLSGIGDVVEDLGQAFRELRPGDRVAVIRASPGGELLAGLSAELSKSRAVLLQGRTKPAKNDCFFDAVVLAAKVLAAPGSGLRRRAIVIIGDDRESGSRRTPVEAVQAAAQAGASVNVLLVLAGASAGSTRTATIGYPPRPVGLDQFPQSSRGQTWESTKALVTRTGGEYRMPESSKERLTGLIRRLNARYLLALALPQSSGSRAPKLSFAVPGVTGAEVRATAAPSFPPALE